ncbi:MAG: polyphosphate polymerase domain-containing protein [Clostridia bacterium]|nr:polyphosphate polymerase domain-containing protein [Clostridia bacterium]MBN2882488.1 polyphosphate polymerase domain-containing protein [Clostridia bacterium]
MYRHELKYMINPGDAQIIRGRLKNICSFDEFTDENGRYRVSSIYFDDFCNSAINDNLFGQLKRKKFRIRVYNNEDKIIKLERKSKNNDGGKKDSALITKDQYSQIMNGEYISLDRNDNEVLNDFLNCQKTRLLKPKVVVEYDREAYIFEPGNVRITFDSNIRSSVGKMDILEKNTITAPVTRDSETIMEIKYTGFLPGFIKNIIKINSSQQAFSKYAACRSYII